MLFGEETLKISSVTGLRTSDETEDCIKMLLLIFVIFRIWEMVCIDHNYNHKCLCKTTLNRRTEGLRFYTPYLYT